MSGKTRTEADFQEKYKQLSDEEIREILLMRKSYQPQAAQAAIKEAISRGILNSEQDLFSEEYNLPANRFGIFPDIRKPEQKAKILSSIHRTLYFIGIIPLVFAGMKYFNGDQSAGIAYAAAGTIWFFLNFLHSKTKSNLILNVMFVLLVVAFGYATYSVSLMKSPEIMDYVATLLQPS